MNGVVGEGPLSARPSGFAAVERGTSDDAYRRHNKPARTGLTASDTAALLHANGPNLLPPPERRATARELLAQMTHFFVMMLWVAGGLAFVAGWSSSGSRSSSSRVAKIS